MRAMAEVRLRVRFEGHVQGVGLRGTLSKYCLRQHVTGWMCNTPDCSLVIAELQGERSLVERVLQSVVTHFSDPRRCRGMSFSVTEELPPIDSERGMFEVRWKDVSSRRKVPS